MKKNFLLGSLFILNLMFSGCANTVYPVAPNSIRTSDGITNVVINKDQNLKSKEFSNSENNNFTKRTYKSDNLMLRQALELVSKKTLAEGKSNFIIINNGTNNLLGFPINTYDDLNKYCLNYNRDSSLDIHCSVFSEFYDINKAIFKFVILDNPDYRIASFNANDVLDELKKSE